MTAAQAQTNWEANSADKCTRCPVPLGSYGRWLVVGFICVVSGFLGQEVVRRPHTPSDVPQFYLASELIRSGQISQIYNPEAYRPFIAKFRAENPQLSSVTWLYFNRPAFEAPLFAPLSLLTYRNAQKAYLWINFLLLLVLIWKLPVWFPRSISARMGLQVFGPFLISLWLGQDTLLLTLLVGFGLHLALKEKDFTAGVIIGLGAFKPHLMALVPLAILAARRWKLLTSFAITTLVLAAVSFAIVGENGMQQWMALLRGPTTDIRPASMGNLRAIVLNLGDPTAIVAGAIALISFGAILWRGSFVTKFSAALLMALLLSPHTYAQDYSLTAVAALAAFSPAALFAVLFPWPFLIDSPKMLPMTFLNLGCLVVLAIKRPSLECGRWFVQLWRQKSWM